MEGGIRKPDENVSRSMQMTKKMDWDRINRENREIRHRNASWQSPEVDWNLPAPAKVRRAKKAAQPRLAARKSLPQTVVIKPPSPLIAALRQIARMEGKDLIGWSFAELRNARDLCQNAAMFLNKRMKEESLRQLRSAKARKIPHCS